MSKYCLFASETRPKPLLNQMMNKRKMDFVFSFDTTEVTMTTAAAAHLLCAIKKETLNRVFCLQLHRANEERWWNISFAFPCDNLQWKWFYSNEKLAKLFKELKFCKFVFALKFGRSFGSKFMSVLNWVWNSENCVIEQKRPFNIPFKFISNGCEYAPIISLFSSFSNLWYVLRRWKNKIAILDR